MEVLYSILGFTGGAVISLVIFFIIYNRSKEKARAGFEAREQILSGEKNRLSAEVKVIQSKYEMVEGSRTDLNKELHSEKEKIISLEKLLAAAGEEQKGLREKLAGKADELNKSEERLREAFQNLANEILKKNTKEFSEVSREKIGNVLNPLREQLEKFEKRVEESSVKGSENHASLKTELQNLRELNKRLSEDATNLTNALKGDTKKMGSWGEMVLERVLELSGLVKGREYTIQDSFRNEKGELLRPDVIINLPDNKHIIVDSKVSLLAYDSYIAETEPLSKEKYLKQHLESIKNHIKLLSEKSYQLAETIDSPDFVFLFMPVEAAFSLAVKTESDFFNYAWDRKIVIVSPTTLLASLRTVASIWKHEKQTQNAVQIAKEGGALYDKFEGFIADLDKLGQQIQTAGHTHEKAMKKLSTGTGNLVKRAERLRELGAKTAKVIPGKFIEDTTSHNEI